MKNSQMDLKDKSEEYICIKGHSTVQFKVPGGVVSLRNCGAPRTYITVGYDKVGEK